MDTVCFEATSFLLFLVAGEVFSFTGWDHGFVSAGCCSSSQSEESEEEEEEEEKDWQSACFLGDTGVDYEYEYEFSHPPGSGVLNAWLAGTLSAFSA